jgi:hypothetical protein
MNMQAIFAVLEQANKLSLEERRTLNTMLCDGMKRDHKLEAAKVSASFNIGDTVVFDAKRKGIIKIQITGFSRDLSTILGTQIGGLRPGCQWKVGATLCNKA